MANRSAVIMESGISSMESVIFDVDLGKIKELLTSVKNMEDSDGWWLLIWPTIDLRIEFNSS